MANIYVGTAPDSWGVWFPENDRQVKGAQFLDEVAQAGYEWIELGPYGFLPTDPAQLSDELAARGLKMSGGTVGENLHVPGSFDAVLSDARDVARLVSAQGAKHVVVLPPMYRDLMTGEQLEPAEMTDEEWTAKTTGLDRLGRALLDEFGIHLQYHPHADAHISMNAHVDRLLHSTDPQYVNLCLDTGHIAYAGGDNLAIIRTYPDRIGYLHLKQVDPAVMEQVRAENLPFSQAVVRGAMVEPPNGIPVLPPLLDEVAALGADIFAIVEQDMYPCEPDAPLPVATRTRRYLSGCGVAAIRLPA